MSEPCRYCGGVGRRLVPHPSGVGSRTVWEICKACEADREQRRRHALAGCAMVLAAIAKARPCLPSCRKRASSGDCETDT